MARTDEPPRAQYLSDLQEHRRRDVARYLAVDLESGIRQIQRCLPNQENVDPKRIDGARLGSDGYYHLARADAPICDGNRVTTRHKVLASPDRWTVTVDGPTSDPSSIPFKQRCPMSRPFWPAYTGGNGAVAGARRVLVAEFGALCMICGVSYAVFVDHSHETGMVRGHLCRWCNSRIDFCVHLEGCLYAEYLNAPPAAHLALPYAVRKERRADDHDMWARMRQMLAEPHTVDLRPREK